ncbi:MAG: hypothetical protein M5U28_25825 [Sandaracinaceae bacterium]|nr:hypothetical protein [Sandaracinaceae bacterium]
MSPLASAPDAQRGRGLLLFYDFSGRELWRAQGAPGERLGSSLTFGADFDANGFDEVVVGAPGANGGAGRAYVVDSRGFLDVFVPGAPGEALGTGVSTPGDVDHDGAPDLVVSMPGIDVAGDSRRGVWMLLSGAGGQNPNQPPALVHP